MDAGKRVFLFHFILSILLYGFVPGIVSLFIDPSVVFVFVLPVLGAIALFHANYLKKLVYSRQMFVSNISTDLFRWVMVILIVICVFRVFFTAIFNTPLEKVLIFSLVFIVLMFGGFDIRRFGFSMKNKLRGLIAGIIAYLLILGSTLGPFYVVLISLGSEIYFDVKIFLIVLPAMLTVGLGEEALFRGLLQRLFIEKLGYRIGIFFSSFVLFALWHIVWLCMYPNVALQIIYITIAGLLGVLIGLAFEGSKNLLPVIIVHGLWDAVMTAISLSTPISQVSIAYYALALAVAIATYCLALVYMRKIISFLYKV